MPLHSRRKSTCGMTLIEATMVLALSAVVVAGVMLYYQSAQANNRLQSAIAELGAIQSGYGPFTPASQTIRI